MERELEDSGSFDSLASYVRYFDHADWVFREGKWPDGASENFSTTEFVGSLEWSWSPMNYRIQSWFVSKSLCGQYILLRTVFQCFPIYLGPTEDNPSGGAEEFDYQTCGYALVGQTSDMEQVAVQGMIREFSREYVDEELDHFHMIRQGGLLNAEKLSHIGIVVWGGVVSD